LVRYIRSGTYVGLAKTISIMYIRYTWQGNHQIYGHVRCIYMLSHAVKYIYIYIYIYIYVWLYGVYTVFLAGKSPNIRSYTVFVHGVDTQPYTCVFFASCRISQH